MKIVLKIGSYLSKLINIYLFGSFSPKLKKIGLEEKKIIELIISKKKKSLNSKAEFLNTKIFLNEIKSLFELNKIRSFFLDSLCFPLFVSLAVVLIRFHVPFPLAFSFSLSLSLHHSPPFSFLSYHLSLSFSFFLFLRCELIHLERRYF